MKVIIGSDTDGLFLKDYIKEVLISRNYEVFDVSEIASTDFIESTCAIADLVIKDDSSFGIAFDGYGVGSFMTATKIKGMIVAEVSDERSAYMTREHNNSKMITLGSKIVGTELAKNIVLQFLDSHYEGGRHQIRVDMLNKMA